MDEEPAVIYVARTLQDAYLLKNLLADEQIESVVLNDMLDAGGAAVLGWRGEARVAVAATLAERARQIATEFDSRLAAAAESPGIEELSTEPQATPPRDWPRCPECNTPRTTQCPACGATGSDFRPADAATIDILGAGAAEEAACGLCCGPCGCTSDEPVPASPTAESEDREAGEPAPGLVCPTCDEPFVPQYARRCETCGHEFSDGIDVESPGEPVRVFNSRVIFAVVAVIFLMSAIAVYFSLVF